MEFDRNPAPYRDAQERLLDFEEIYTDHDVERLTTQGARCMDCGVPFCQSNEGCPIHNLIPEWNDLVYRGQWRGSSGSAAQNQQLPRVHRPRLPGAVRRRSCVLGITDPAVTIKNIEMAIVDRGFAEGWVAQPAGPCARARPWPSSVPALPASPRRAAQQGRPHSDRVRARRSHRRAAHVRHPEHEAGEGRGGGPTGEHSPRAEGVSFVTGTAVGDGSDGSVDVGRTLHAENDAVLLATGATVPRDLPIPGRELNGVHFAMEFLTANTKSLLDSQHEDGNFISARDKHVIVIGGGDTGTDCIGTSLRHGCKSLVNFELFPQPPEDRAPNNPWPTWPKILRTDYGHQEAVQVFGDDPRTYSISSTEFVGDDDGNLKAVRTVDVEMKDGKFENVPGSEREWQADLVFLAMGFLGPEHAVSDALGLDYDERSNYKADYGVYATDSEKVFVAGDCRRGQSLVVRAINEGREAAREIDRFLMGSTQLP